MKLLYIARLMFFGSLLNVLNIFCLKDIKPLKVLFVVTHFPPKSGAAVLNQIIGLIDKGLDVDIYSINRGDMQWAHPEALKYKLFDKVYYERLPANIEKYDIIYAQSGYRGKGCVELKKKFGSKVKLVTCFRGQDTVNCLKNKPKFYSDLFHYGDLFLPVCKTFKDLLIKNGCRADKIKVHHSGIDCKLFSYRERHKEKNEPIKIITVCRLVEKKGLRYSIEAVALLIRQGHHIEYTIVGGGPLMQELENQVKKLGIQEHVKFLGNKLVTEIPALLDKAHIFVLPSVTAESGDQEGIPNVLKEAMLCGIPVISTYHSGIPELIVHNESGLLVEPENVDVLKQAIEYLIENPELWAAMGAAGWAKVKAEYDKDSVNTILVGYFQKLME